MEPLTREQGHLYFHSPCFDGIVSAVVAWDFLEAKQGWTVTALHAVNYGLREQWLSSTLETPCAIVDFLYHSRANFWADHHLTSFLDENAENDFERRRNPSLIYDDHASSCAKLLWDHFAQAFSYRNSRYVDIVRWADKIDSARYESVNEAIFAPAPALRISMGLAVDGHDGFSERLVRALREGSLDEVADLPDVRERYERAQSLIKQGLDRFSKGARLDSDGIVVFDVEDSGTIISRYAPYYFFPDARYSAGVIRGEGVAKVTAMRNPWREFHGVSLGRIFETLGGGGHHRVGSVVLRGERVRGVPQVLSRLLRAMRREEEANVTGGPTHD